MKAAVITLLTLVFLTAISISASAIDLVVNGKSLYKIVTPANPAPAEITAAKELQEHLLAMSGAKLPILPESQISKINRLILVGQTGLTRKMMPSANWKSLGTDGIVILTKGNNLILAGGRPRGGLYAVYTFLEDNLGVRWWSHNESYIPQKSTIRLNKIYTRYIPQILCREAHFYEPNHYEVYAARTKQTGHFHPISKAYGGHYSILGFCHTFYQLIPPEKYFKEHPEWFSLVNGKRTSDAAQLCLSNEEMRKELVKNALEWIRKDPSAGIISIAQNDWRGQCECPECAAQEKAEGSPSGPVINFVNKVAADIEKTYPNFLVETLAYQYTRTAPKTIRPRKNVIIRLCSIECDYGLPFTDSKNKSFKDDLEAWSKISNHLFIWSYIANFGNYLYPNPCLPVYETNIRLFEKNKAAGVFMQGDAYNEGACFVRLRSWVIAHLLWNPSLSEKNLVKEFMDGYYGAASPYLNKYLELVNAAYARHASANWMTPNDIYEGLKLFEDAAEAVKNDPVLLDRVNRERLPLDYLVINNSDTLKSWCSENNKEIKGLQNLQASIAEFEAATEKYNVRYSNENGLLAPRLKFWKLTVGREVKQPTELGDLSGKKTMDIQESRMTLYNEGSWVNMLEDPEASNNMACVMPATGSNWAVQSRVDNDMYGKWHVYAAVKIDPIAGSGTAFASGIYDSENKTDVVNIKANIEDMPNNQYKLIDYGIQDLKSGCYFWFAPANNPNEIKSISVDRIFLVAE